MLLPEIGHIYHVNQIKDMFVKNGFVEIEMTKLRPTVIPTLFGNIDCFVAKKFESSIKKV